MCTVQTAAAPYSAIASFISEGDCITIMVTPIATVNDSVFVKTANGLSATNETGRQR